MQPSAKQLGQQAIIQRITQNHLSETIQDSSVISAEFLGHDAKGYRFRTQSQGFVYADIVSTTEPVRGQCYNLQKMEGTDKLFLRLQPR